MSRASINSQIQNNIAAVSALVARKAFLEGDIAKSEASIKGWEDRIPLLTFRTSSRHHNPQKAAKDLKDANASLKTWRERLSANKAEAELIPGQIQDLNNTNSTLRANLASMDEQDLALSKQGLTRTSVDLEARREFDAAENRGQVYLYFGIGIALVVLIFLVIYFRKRSKKKGKK